MVERVFLLTALAMIVSVPSAHAVEFKISGQINRAVLWGENGADNDLFFVDNDNSSTRFRFTGSNDFDHGFSVGINWEVEMQSNASNKVDIDDNDDVTDIHFDERKIEFWIHHAYGKLWLGQGSTASDGTAEVDLSGTTVVTYAAVTDMAGGFTFRAKGDKNTKIAEIQDVSSDFDGLSRRDRIRYDTPKFGPVSFSASAGNGQIWDVSGWFAYEWENLGKLAAAVAYADGQSRFGYKQAEGSASFLHKSGFSITVAHGTRFDRDGGANDARTYYAKLGFTRGKHAASVDYGRTDDLDQDHDKFTTVGVGYVFSPWQSVELYAAWRIHSLDRGDIADPDDIHAVMTGGRVKF